VTFLLDTNVIFEWGKPEPNANVIAWLGATDEDQVYLSVASFAERQTGIELLPRSRRRNRLTSWLAQDLPTRFEGRILDVDRRTAEAWGTVMGLGRKAGVTVGTMDALFAATAEVNGLTLVTRNIKDLQKLGIPLLDPWNP
jgi:predicted nucleic acid-binding protein